MNLIVLIPALVCWVMLARKSVRHALIYVYLPSVLLLPHYFVFRPAHMPPLTFADMAILPIGIALYATELRRWRLDWMDLWVVLFAVSAALSEGMSNQLANGEWVRLFTASATASQSLNYTLANGELRLFAGITSIILPYMTGKLLIESGHVGGQSTRRAMVKCMVVCLAIVTFLSLRDFLGGGSIWQTVFKHFFPGQTVDWPLQMRWGFGRITGPFAHAILAGMVFLAGSVYCLWLLRVDRKWGTRRVLAGLPVTQRGLATFAIVAGLLMTQSRGPWIGLALAVVFAMLVRVLPVAKAAAVFMVLVAVLAAVGYGFGSKYTSVSRAQATSEEQASAVYRRELLQSYTPVIMQRKAFGWGFTDIPAANGQKSIDNQFLWLAVTQGFVGLGLFLTIAAGSGLRLLMLASRPSPYEDRMLIFAHMAVLMGLLSTLATVYMGEQVVLLFFFIIGWVQGMKPAPARAGTLAVHAPRFSFRRVLN